MQMKKVTESIADSPTMNHRIERALKALAPADQTRTLDALEALKNAGPTGISPSAWATAVKSLHPDEGYNISDLLKSTVRNFSFVVKRIGDKLYAWSEKDEGNDGYDPQTVAAVKSQVDLSKIALDAMKELGEFSLEDLGKVISLKTGMPSDAAIEYANHVMGQFIGGMLQQVSPGRYRVQADEPKTAADHMAMFRDMLKDVGRD